MPKQKILSDYEGSYYDGNRDATTFKERLTTSFVYTKVKALERDNFKCRICEDGTSNLCVHHLVSAKKSRDHNLENLVSLCIRCHQKIHPSHNSWDKPNKCNKANCVAQILSEENNKKERRTDKEALLIRSFFCLKDITSTESLIFWED